MPFENTLEQKMEFKNLIKKMSSFFVKNKGQLNSMVKYYCLNENFSCYLTSKKAVFSFIKNEDPQENIDIKSNVEALKNNIFNAERNNHLEKLKGVALFLKFLEANDNVEIITDCECRSKINYFKGKDSSMWHQELCTYEKIIYKNLWDNIDLAFFCVNGQLKYEFILHPGASVDDIKLIYLGCDNISLDKKGNLIINTELGTLIDKKPLSYQLIGNERVIVKSSFVLENRNMFSFDIEDSYDKNYMLVIAPELECPAYLGGCNNYFGNGIAVDNNSNAYVTGSTLSTNFPITSGAFDPMDPDISNYNVFVSKIDTTASGVASLVYSTYLGGKSNDEGLGIAVDSDGFAYVTGYTDSTDFPVTPTGYQPIAPSTGTSIRDAFMTKLSANGSMLLYSTYLGGNDSDLGRGIAVDNVGNAYVIGDTLSTDFPITPSAYQTTAPNPGSVNAFVTKFDTLADGPTSLAYSTYLCGTSDDSSRGISCDNNGNAYVTGFTLSTDLPTTPEAYQPTDPSHGSNDAFVIKINTIPLTRGLKISPVNFPS